MSTELGPELRAAILKQVEFYFSDANLPSDEFMRKQVARQPDGFVPLGIIAGFKRMKALCKYAASFAIMARLLYIPPVFVAYMLCHRHGLWLRLVLESSPPPLERWMQAAVPSLIRGTLLADMSAVP